MNGTSVSSTCTNCTNTTYESRGPARDLDGSVHHVQDAQVGDHTGASSSSDERQVTVLEAPKLAVASSGSGAEDKAEEELQAQAGCMEEVHLLVEVLALASAHGTETSDDRA